PARARSEDRSERAPDAEVRVSLGGDADALGDLDECVAQPAPELVPFVDVRRRLRAQLVGRQRQLLGRLVDPRSDLTARDLGVELDAPRALSEPERLRADRAPRELVRAGRDA